MNDPMFELMQNRSKLLARIAAQRELMTGIEADWRAPLALADRGVAVVRFLRCHPLLVAGVSVVGLMWGVWRARKGYRDFTSISAKSSLPG
jgi:hypothetical protein